MQIKIENNKITNYKYIYMYKYLSNRVFLSRNYRLLAVPRKFDVLKENMLVLRTSIFKGSCQSDSSETCCLYAGDIVLCSCIRDFTLTVSLSTQAYKWVPANLMLEVTLRWNSIPSSYQGGVENIEILLVASCYSNRNELLPERPLS